MHRHAARSDHRTPAVVLAVATAIALPALVAGCWWVPPVCIEARRPEDNAVHSLPVGTRLPLRAGLLDILEECDRPLEGPASWASASPHVARVDANGVVTAVAPGVADVAVTYGVVRVAYRVRVVPPVARLRILPEGRIFPVGDTVVFRAVALDSAGREVPGVPIALAARDVLASQQRFLGAFGRTATPWWDGGDLEALRRYGEYLADERERRRTEGNPRGAPPLPSPTEGPPPVVPPADSAPPPPPRTLPVVATRPGWGHVIAWIVGRADSVPVVFGDTAAPPNARPTPAARPSAPR